MSKITKIHDNIAFVVGSQKYKQEDFFKLSPSADGVIVSATKDSAELLIIGDPSSIKIGSKIVKKKENFSEIKLHSSFLGSVISPFGEVLYTKNKNKSQKIIGKGDINRTSPQILDRSKLTDPLKTGILSIDTIIPIGKGQRELIIGDRKTGKSAIALSTIINQSDKNVYSIYIAVGAKRSTIIETYNILAKNNSIKNTIIIFANPDSSAEQLYAPKIGMTMAEILSYQGNDVLVIIDDLSKHADVAREVSLSIGRNPGREAYPADIFYQHSRLLERAGKFNEKYKNGTITCLPIVQTVQGDIATLIPSNVISITDGQIFTSTEKANNGHFPAINIGLSVSRTGSAVQSKIIKQASKDLKANYANLEDIKKFADMSIDISPDLKEKIDSWFAINNLLVQNGFKGYTETEILILTEIFRMKKLSKIHDKNKFSTVFTNYARKNEASKKLIEQIKSGKYKNDKERMRKMIEIVFVPLINAASGHEDSIVSRDEYLNMKGAE